MAASDSGVWTLVSGSELKRELNQRRTPYLYQKVAPGRRDQWEADGWEFDRRNKKSLRMKKPKPVGQALEDQVWSLLASMGFQELNKGRHFRIPIGSAKPKQVDVFAKDELSALIVSCKENKRYGGLSLQGELESLNGLRSKMRREIETHYSQKPPHFVGFVLATRNVRWSRDDENRAREYGIKPFRDDELEYFLKLTDLVDTAARYQLMGELFEGNVIPRMTNRKVAAIKGRYKNTQFYQFVVDAETLARIGFVQHRARLDRDREITYQRLIQRRRMKEIAEYINEDSVFPTNVVINFTSPNKRLVFEQAEKSQQASDDLVFGKLILPNTFKSAWIIDGQHRLFGYFHRTVRDGYRERRHLPVLAFENLPHEDEANLFIDINNKQVKVQRNLLLELKADLDFGSDDPIRAFDAIVTRIVLELNKDRQSPLYDLIKSERATRSKAFLTLDQIVTAIKIASLVGQIHASSKRFNAGVLYGKDDLSCVQRSFDVVSSFLRLFSEGAKAHWDLRNKRNQPDSAGGYLCTNIGVASLIGLLGSLVEYLGEAYDLDFEKMAEADFVQSVEAYSKPVVEYFRNPTYEEVLRFRRHLGAQAPRHGMRQMQQLIRASDPQYNPDGLDEYLKEQEKEEVNELNEIYRPLETDLLDILVHQLKDAFGERWFTDGVPLPVKTKVIAEQDKDKSKSYEQCFFMPTDAKTIMQANHQMFQSLFHEGDLKWMDKLIEVRIGISHAPYKIKPQYKDFLEKEVRPAVYRAKQELGLASPQSS